MSDEKIEKVKHWLKILFLLVWSLVNIASGRYMFFKFKVYVGQNYFILKDMGVLLVVLGLLGLIYTYMEATKKTQ